MQIHAYDGHVNDEDRELPLYVATVGESIPQSPIHRPAGINDYQLLYTKSGVGIVRIREREYEVGEGELFILPPFTPHEYRPNGDGWVTLWITYSGSAAKTCFGFQSDIKTAPEFEVWFKKILRLKKRDGWRRKTSPLLYSLLLDVANKKGLGKPEESQAVPDVSAAVQYIAEHYRETVELSVLAELSGLSEGHFCRVFKRHTHMRPIEYVTNLRMERAKDLLITRPPLPVSEIAEMVGYASAAYFSKTFKEKCNTTPEKYRENGLSR